MASIVYDSFPADAMNGNAVTSNSYKAMLVSSSYAEDRGHSKRSQVTNELAAGNGYAAGGAAVTVTVGTNTATHETTLTIGAVSWPSSTLAARKMIVYRARGGASSADELVCCVDNGATDLVSSSSTMQWNASTWKISLPAPV